MRKISNVLFGILLILFARTADANWCLGIIHTHSTFSDGGRMPKMLKNAAAKLGCQFLIVTDHAEQIDKKKKGTGLNLVTDDFGYEKYLSQFSVKDPLVCIAGTEIATSEGSHILALVHSTDVFKENISGGNQQNIISKLNALQALPIAAHPHLEKYPFQKSQAEGICGIEFFNEGSAEYQKTLAWYLELVIQGKNPFVTAGCDSHTSVDPTDKKRWQRRTFVYLNGESTAGNILSAIAAGRTYATNSDIRLLAWFFSPYYENRKQTIPLDLSFMFRFVNPSPKTQTLRFRIYRDGLLFEEKTGSMLIKANQDYFYYCKDKDVKPGNHTYIVEIEHYLITSPIHVVVE